jgi:hypothetical protein
MFVSTVHIVACRPVARPTPRKKQRENSCYATPRLTRLHNGVTVGNGISYSVCEKSYKEDNWGDPVSCQLKVSLWRKDCGVSVKWTPAWEADVSWEWVLYGRLWRKELVARLRLWKEDFNVIFGVCNSVRLLIVPMLKSVGRKRLVETVIDWGH